MLLGLALAGGGFSLGSRHVAGLAVWLILVGMLALGLGGRATLGRPFYWAVGLIGALALFSASSSLWSGSVELSVTEADRVLVYLGFFIAAFLIAQTDQRRQRFAEGIAISLIGVAILALASRLLPHVLALGAGPGSNSRLGYPLGYWNANGVAFGIGTVLSLWLSRHSLNASLRGLAVGSLPALLLALYFTYSRGGLLALLVAGICLLALSPDRLWLLGTLAVGAVGAVPAVLWVQAHETIANNYDNPSIASQGATVLLLLLAGIALSLALWAGLRRLEARGGMLTGRALALSRDRRVLRGIALAAALLGIGVAIAVGGRAWHQFSSSDVQLPNQPQQHFGELSGSGRNEFWRVALDAFAEDPVAGKGAGTYRFAWDQLRHTTMPVLEAHSLYLQAFAELGLIGGLLVLGLMLFLLWTGFAAWRAASGPRRDLYAALLAACLTFAIGAAIDWFWAIAGLGAVFFLAAAALVAARCGQLAEARVVGNGRGERRRYGVAIAGLAVAWISALALIGPLLVHHEIDASQAASNDGNVAAAIEHAKTARSIEPWAASPYLQLGLLYEGQGNFAGAAEMIGKAIDREEGNWLLYYLRARVEHEAGEEAAARADLREALRLNPRESCIEEGPEAC